MRVAFGGASEGRDTVLMETVGGKVQGMIRAVVAPDMRVCRGGCWRVGGKRRDLEIEVLICVSSTGVRAWRSWCTSVCLRTTGMVAMDGWCGGRCGVCVFALKFVYRC